MYFILYLVINIVILDCFLFDISSAIMSSLFFNNIITSTKIIFWDFFLGFGILFGTFLLVKVFYLIAILLIALLFFLICQCMAYLQWPLALFKKPKYKNALIYWGCIQWEFLVKFFDSQISLFLLLENCKKLSFQKHKYDKVFVIGLSKTLPKSSYCKFYF